MCSMATALARAVEAARPDVVIHQFTDLPQAFDPAALAAASARNARLRRGGDCQPRRRGGGCRRATRVVAQSIAFVYAPGPAPHGEDDPLDASPAQAVTVAGVPALERLVTEHARHRRAGAALRPLLRAGHLAERTGSSRPPSMSMPRPTPPSWPSRRGAPGIYNIADDDGAVSSAKAERELGFAPGFRIEA